MSEPLICAVRSANGECAAFLQERMPSNPDGPGSFPSTSRIEALAKRLFQVGNLLPGLAREEGNSPGLKSELLLYKANLKRLQQILPDVHANLRACRRRLEADRANLHAVRAWAETFKDTV